MMSLAFETLISEPRRVWARVVVGERRKRSGRAEEEAARLIFRGKLARRIPAGWLEFLGHGLP